MRKVAVAQTVSSRGLGDALQSYVTIRLLNDLIFESEITFICAYLKYEFSVFEAPKYLNGFSIHLEKSFEKFLFSTQ